ncbi:sortase [Evansella sp. AB-rgal1]|uniref:sortase n=1 Tax=Evansella sp. AB-rgal1 TaxID=3242696 RepID=UPI00359DC22C
MPNQLKNLLVIVCLFISLTFVITSLIQIQLGSTQVDQSLEEWNTQTANLQVELLIQDHQEKPTHQRTHKTAPNIPTIDEDTQNKEQPYQLIYENRPSRGDIFGKMYIPRLDREIPIISGTDDEELDKGVGHFIGSVLPGENDNTVFAGHNNTVFRNFDQIQLGDLIEIETHEGTFIYQLKDERIVHEDDRTVIISYDEPVITLITCYPLDFFGFTTERYILTGKLIESNGQTITN